MFQIDIGPSPSTIKSSENQCKNCTRHSHNLNSESIQLIDRYELICRPTHATTIWIDPKNVGEFTLRTKGTID